MGRNNTKFTLTRINKTLMKQQEDITEIISCNEYTNAYGLALTEKQAVRLVETRKNALQKTGRIELGGGVIDKLIATFCDSPYISQQNYETTLHELIDLFYDFKNDTWDSITDDELIGFMKKAFNENCHGSLELLSSRDLMQLSQHIRQGKSFISFKLCKEE